MRRLSHDCMGQFYQKHVPHSHPPFIRTAKSGEVEYINLDSLSTLLWLGNLAALEFHPSFEYIGGEEPAEWVLDIDPSRKREPRLMEAVARIGEALEEMGVHSVPKTSIMCKTAELPKEQSV